MAYDTDEFSGFLTGKPFQFDDFNSFDFRNNFWALKKAYDFFPIAKGAGDKGRGITISEGIFWDRTANSIFALDRKNTFDAASAITGTTTIYERARIYIPAGNAGSITPGADVWSTAGVLGEGYYDDEIVAGVGPFVPEGEYTTPTLHGDGYRWDMFFLMLDTSTAPDELKIGVICDIWNSAGPNWRYIPATVDDEGGNPCNYYPIAFVKRMPAQEWAAAGPPPVGTTDYPNSQILDVRPVLL